MTSSLLDFNSISSSGNCLSVGQAIMSIINDFFMPADSYIYSSILIQLSLSGRHEKTGFALQLESLLLYPYWQTIPPSLPVYLDCSILIPHYPMCSIVDIAPSKTFHSLRPT